MAGADKAWQEFVWMTGVTPDAWHTARRSVKHALVSGVRRTRCTLD